MGTAFLQLQRAFKDQEVFLLIFAHNIRSHRLWLFKLGFIFTVNF